MAELSSVTYFENSASGGIQTRLVVDAATEPRVLFRTAVVDAPPGPVEHLASGMADRGHCKLTSTSSTTETASLPPFPQPTSPISSCPKTPPTRTVRLNSGDSPTCGSLDASTIRRLPESPLTSQPSGDDPAGQQDSEETRQQTTLTISSSTRGDLVPRSDSSCSSKPSEPGGCYKRSRIA